MATDDPRALAHALPASLSPEARTTLQVLLLREAPPLPEEAIAQGAAFLVSVLRAELAEREEGTAEPPR